MSRVDDLRTAYDQLVAAIDVTTARPGEDAGPDDDALLAILETQLTPTTFQRLREHYTTGGRRVLDWVFNDAVNRASDERDLAGLIAAYTPPRPVAPPLTITPYRALKSENLQGQFTEYYENVDGKLCLAKRDANDKLLRRSPVLSRSLEFTRIFTPALNQLGTYQRPNQYRVLIGDDVEVDEDLEGIKRYLERHGLVLDSQQVKSAVPQMLDAATQAIRDHVYYYPCVTFNEYGQFQLVLPQTHKLIGTNDTQQMLIAGVAKRTLARDAEYIRAYRQIITLVDYRMFKILVIAGYVAVAPFFHCWRLMPGNNFLPDLMLFGAPGTGKTTTTLAFTRIYGVVDAMAADEINSDFRLGEALSSSGFPLIVDDINNLKPQLFGMLKASRTGNVNQSRGNKDRSIDRYPQIAPFIETTNERAWVQEELAYLERAPMIVFDGTDKRAIDEHGEQFDAIIHWLDQRREICANQFYADVFDVIDAFYDADITPLEKLQRVLAETRARLKSACTAAGVQVGGRHLQFWAWIHVSIRIWRDVLARPLAWVEVIPGRGFDTRPIDQYVAMDGYVQAVDAAERAARHTDMTRLEALWGHFNHVIMTIAPPDAEFDHRFADYGIIEYGGEWFVTQAFIVAYNKTSRNRDDVIPTLSEFIKLQNRVLGEEDTALSRWVGKTQTIYCAPFRNDRITQLFGVSEDRTGEPADSPTFGQDHIDVTFNVDAIQLGASRGQTKRAARVFQIIADLQDASGDSVPREAIVERALVAGVGQTEVNEILDALVADSQITYKRDDSYVVLR